MNQKQWGKRRPQRLPHFSGQTKGGISLLWNGFSPFIQRDGM